MREVQKENRDGVDMTTIFTMRNDHETDIAQITFTVDLADQVVESAELSRWSETVAVPRNQLGFWIKVFGENVILEQAYRDREAAKERAEERRGEVV